MASTGHSTFVGKESKHIYKAPLRLMSQRRQLPVKWLYALCSVKILYFLSFLMLNRDGCDLNISGRLSHIAGAQICNALVIVLVRDVGTWSNCWSADLVVRLHSLYFGWPKLIVVNTTVAILKSTLDSTRSQWCILSVSSACVLLVTILTIRRRCSACAAV